ncbi:MAG TPA: hypothetical protein PKA37_09925, partial [Planctomycetota bacterium]|nr:hypothetical protein [Planctomycetota bacterium]
LGPLARAWCDAGLFRQAATGVPYVPIAISISGHLAAGSCLDRYPWAGRTSRMGLGALRRP